MDKDPKQLYQEVILRHSNAPFHFEKWEEAPLVIEAYNPLCGDQFRLFLELEGDKVVKASFHGYGCAISKASTSILIEKILGKTIEEIHQLALAFYQIVRPEGGTLEADADEELLAFAAARQFPARLQCATLSWEALEKGVGGE